MCNYNNLQAFSAAAACHLVSSSVSQSTSQLPHLSVLRLHLLAFSLSSSLPAAAHRNELSGHIAAAVAAAVLN